jgi:hypothetical protein
MNKKLLQHIQRIPVLSYLCIYASYEINMYFFKFLQGGFGWRKNVRLFFS